MAAMAEARRDRARLAASRRLAIVFAALVLLPATALAVLAYGQVARERRALAAEREGELRDAERRIRADLLAAFAELRAVEEDRPWYHYNPVYYDPNAVGTGVNYLKSPLAGKPANPLVATYFQVEPDGSVLTPGGQVADDLSPAQQERVKVARQAAAADGAQAGASNVQNVGRRGFEANALPRKTLRDIQRGAKEPDVPPEDGADSYGYSAELSALRFEAEKDGSVIAWRYVDLPIRHEVGGNGVRLSPDTLRYVQGFRIDMGYVRDGLVPELAGRYLAVPGARAALVRDERGDLPPLPGFAVEVTDGAPDFVDRQVASLSRLLLGAAGLLLLVMTGGLLFALRAVRAEVSLARRRSDFVSAVTHELRTPLTGIRMYADLLREGWVADEKTRDEYLGFLAAETDRLSRLVNRVLDFARSERRRAPVGPIDLAEPVRAVEREFGPRLADEGFALGVEIETRRRAIADADATKQILLNLLDNAGKYAAGATDRRIRVRVADDRDGVALSVADHGPGVPPAERERIFEDFYRPGEELTRERPGAGLGLALVRRLAASMGARVRVAETPGGGATFVVRFRVPGAEENSS